MAFKNAILRRIAKKHRSHSRRNAPTRAEGCSQGAVLGKVGVSEERNINFVRSRLSTADPHVTSLPPSRPLFLPLNVLYTRCGTNTALPATSVITTSSAADVANNYNSGDGVEEEWNEDDGMVM